MGNVPTKKDRELKVLKLIRSDTGFVIVPLHFTMDPEKQSQEWLLEERAKYDRENLETEEPNEGAEEEKKEGE